MSSISKDCYCAFCRVERKVYTKKNISGVNILLSGLSAVIAMFFIWQEFDPRVILLFFFSLAVAEIFVNLRWRMTVACQYCGFDPVEYLKSPESVAKKVKLVLEKRREEPAYLLSTKNPFRHLPPRKVPRSLAVKESSPSQ